MRRRRLGLLVLGSIVAAACGSDDQGPQDPPLVVAKPATKSGDQQTAPISTALGNPLRILITQDGEPVEGVDVEWVAGQGGSFSEETESDELGIASAVWTLGPEVGNHAATASIDDATGSPLTYTAVATERHRPAAGTDHSGAGTGGRESLRARAAHGHRR